MEKILVSGNGPLRGETAIAGAKNAALPAIAATLLSAEPVTISNVPQVRDISTALELLVLLGCSMERDGSELTLTGAGVHSVRAPYELVRTMRGSILLLGPLLARFGVADVSLPGGCAIGSRPVNEHIAGLERMGAEITIDAGYIKAKCRRLRGANISFDTPSVTATENLMMAASLADGVTTIENAALEPEVSDLALLLSSMGAKVTGAGTSTIRISGCRQLHGARHRMPPDRIESGTFLTAAAATRGDVTIRETQPAHLGLVLSKLKSCGAELTVGEDWIRLQSHGRRPRAVSISTAPYPAFPTDMQAQFVALNAVAEGTATAVENIFENRFMHVAELQRMGADIELQGHTAVINGRERLQGAPVMATDLRASASLIIAALVADGQSSIDRVYHLDRGYANIVEKLASLGANIQRMQSE
ncbi:MAG: UDP-N-acetylglucosamine 1-carboxyvinyltransferase [Halieaceae bacterium]|nr:UDP-N-acetylglucosamine 1-carboxyvinyltransferase [Halieaceae bacterium]